MPLRRHEPAFDHLTNSEKKILGIKPEATRPADKPQTPSVKRALTDRMKKDKPVAEWE